ncbi:MAG: gamma-glutamyl-gamma-aminobutyrate hydrolase family protein [Bacteroidales bacterium]
MKKIPFLLIITLMLGALGCKKTHTMIAVTKLTDNYQNWLLKADSTLDIVNLIKLPLDSAERIMEQADGLLVTGGGDIHPGLYGKEYDTAICKDIDPRRDSLETMALRKAFERKIPVLGICRGFQMINIFLGGTLLPDLPRDMGDEVMHQCPDPMNCLHPIQVEPHTMLHRITGFNEGMVNSNHHQGIDQLAADLKATAFSSDHLIEAIEWKDAEGKSWLLAVQWHPERLKENPVFSEPLAAEFIRQVKIHKN